MSKRCWTFKIIFTLDFPVRKTYKSYCNKKILVTNLHHILSTDSKDTSMFNYTSYADKCFVIQTVNTHTPATGLSAKLWSILGGHETMTKHIFLS